MPSLHKNLLCFAHGMESEPWGHKITELAPVARALGFEVMSPDYRFTMDPQARLGHLLTLRPQAERLVLMGSSMGAYVAAMACRELKPQALLLLAPALYLPGYEGEPEDCPADTVVVHGWRDEVIPPENSIRFAQTRGAALHLVNSDHPLSDQLPLLKPLLQQMLQRVLSA